MMVGDKATPNLPKCLRSAVCNDPFHRIPSERFVGCGGNLTLAAGGIYDQILRRDHRRLNGNCERHVGDVS